MADDQKPAPSLDDWDNLPLDPHDTEWDDIPPLTAEAAGAATPAPGPETGAPEAEDFSPAAADVAVDPPLAAEPAAPLNKATEAAPPKPAPTAPPEPELPVHITLTSSPPKVPADELTAAPAPDDDFDGLGQVSLDDIVMEDDDLDGPPDDDFDFSPEPAPVPPNPGAAGPAGAGHIDVGNIDVDNIDIVIEDPPETFDAHLAEAEAKAGPAVPTGRPAKFPAGLEVPAPPQEEPGQDLSEEALSPPPAAAAPDLSQAAPTPTATPADPPAAPQENSAPAEAAAIKAPAAGAEINKGNLSESLAADLESISAQKVELDIEGIVLAPPAPAEEEPEAPIEEDEPEPPAMEEEAPPPAPAEEAPPSPPESPGRLAAIKLFIKSVPPKKMLIIALPALLIFVGLAFGAYKLFFSSSVKEAPTAAVSFDPTVPPREPEPGALDLGAFYLSFPAQEGETIVEMTVVLHYLDLPDRQKLEENLTRVRDIIYRAARAKGDRVVADGELQRALREELAEEIGRAIGRPKGLDYVQIVRFRVLR